MAKGPARAGPVTTPGRDDRDPPLPPGVDAWVARQVKIRKGQLFSFSGANCSMAAGLAYAIGAAAAFPGRQVVIFTGDGSATMQLGDFLTGVQPDLPIQMIVVKNTGWG